MNDKDKIWLGKFCSAFCWTVAFLIALIMFRLETGAYTDFAFLLMAAGVCARQGQMFDGQVTELDSKLRASQVTETGKKA